MPLFSSLLECVLVWKFKRGHFLPARACLFIGQGQDSLGVDGSLDHVGTIDGMPELWPLGSYVWRALPGPNLHGRLRQVTIGPYAAAAAGAAAAGRTARGLHRVEVWGETELGRHVAEGLIWTVGIRRGRPRRVVWMSRPRQVPGAATFHDVGSLTLSPGFPVVAGGLVPGGGRPEPWAVPPGLPRGASDRASKAPPRSAGRREKPCMASFTPTGTSTTRTTWWSIAATGS